VGLALRFPSSSLVVRKRWLHFEKLRPTRRTSELVLIIDSRERAAIVIAPHQRLLLLRIVRKLHWNSLCRHHCGCVRLGPFLLCCCSYRRRRCSPPPQTMHQTYHIAVRSTTCSFRRGAGRNAWHRRLQQYRASSDNHDRRLFETLRSPSSTAEAYQQLHSTPLSLHVLTVVLFQAPKHVLAHRGRSASECGGRT
jgi:hypothetical protein